MRRLLCLILCLSLFPVSAPAGEPAKYVALTFDDGPSGRFTRALLDGLAQRGVKATFLLCGYRMEQEPEELGRIFNEGHEIGLHGFSHDCMAKQCLAQIEREINDCMALLPPGCTPVFLRPPGGQVCADVRAAARNANLAILNWSVDPRDWATHQADRVEEAVLGKVRDGDVVLLHDMSDSSVEAALAIVDVLQEKGFTFVTASQLAAIRGTALEPGKTYTRFPPADDRP